MLSAEEQAQLSALAASGSLPHTMVARARLVLWAAQGDSNSAIAERLDWSMPMVGKWRRRFVEQRAAGLHDELRPGRPRTLGDEQVAGLINRLVRSQPKKRHPLERALGGRSNRHLQEHHGALFRAFRVATASQQEPQSFHRSVLRGKSATWWGFTSTRRTRRWCCV